MLSDLLTLNCLVSVVLSAYKTNRLAVVGRHSFFAGCHLHPFLSKFYPATPLDRHCLAGDVSVQLAHARSLCALVAFAYLTTRLAGLELFVDDLRSGCDFGVWND